MERMRGRTIAVGLVLSWDKDSDRADNDEPDGLPVPLAVVATRASRNLQAQHELAIHYARLVARLSPHCRVL